METTEGTLLGGRVRYVQPADGYRTGIEPVLLAAAVPARPGQLVLEGGTGAGAGLLCLAARIPGVRGLGVELDGEMAALGRRNMAGVAGLAVLTGDVTALDLPPADHAFANPPWHAAASTASPLARRRLAKQGDVAGAWITALARALRPGGTLSLILPAAACRAAAEAMLAAGLEAAVVVPLLPRAGRPAKLAVVGGGPGRRRGLVEGGPIVLHGEGGGYTEPVERVLRGGAGLFEAQGGVNSFLPAP